MVIVVLLPACLFYTKCVFVQYAATDAVFVTVNRVVLLLHCLLNPLLYVATMKEIRDYLRAFVRSCHEQPTEAVAGVAEVIQHRRPGVAPAGDIDREEAH